MASRQNLARVHRSHRDGSFRDMGLSDEAARRPDQNRTPRASIMPVIGRHLLALSGAILFWVLAVSVWQSLHPQVCYLYVP